MAYTPPRGDAVTLQLDGAYTAPGGESVILALDDFTPDAISGDGASIAGVSAIGAGAHGVVGSCSALAQILVSCVADRGVVADGIATLGYSAIGAGSHLLGWQVDGGGSALPTVDHDSVLLRLLGYLYRSFDKSPDKTLALRVGHQSGLVWTVQNRTLSIRTFAGVEIGDVDLVGISMDDLAERLRVLGCEIRYQNPTVSGWDADSLLDGQGQEWTSNGDHLYCYGSLLWSLLDAFALELERSLAAMESAVREMYLDLADGVWLDFWGGYFGVERWVDETDRKSVV
jgi:hypothetical protein